MPTYGNPHVLPPAQCSTNTPASQGYWTQDNAGITNSSTPVRASHINDLRTLINAELSRRYLTAATWTQDSPTVTAGVTPIRASHINDLRNAILSIKTGGCSDANYCPGDNSGSMIWSQDSSGTTTTISAGTTPIRSSHISDLRTKLTSLMTSCICESEQCTYCADCGFQYMYCSHNGVACHNSQGHESCGYMLPTGSCASVNAGGANPDISATCTYSYYPYANPDCYQFSSLAQTGWTGSVPWVMGATPPGTSWASTNYDPTPGNISGDSYANYGVNGHLWTSPSWSCMCNPYYNCAYYWCHR